MQAVHGGYRPIQMRSMRPSTVRVRPSQAVYRRRRLAVLLLATITGLTAWFGLHQLTGVSGGGPLTAAGQPVSQFNVRLATDVRMIVQPGDTLWTLARRAQPTGDVRPLVQSLEAQRHGRMLMVGEHITVSLAK